MMTLLSVLIIITCVLLVLIVLIQNPKGGGLSSSFGGSGTQLFGGVKKTTDFLDRGTWVLAIALVVLVLAANVMNDPGTSPVQQEDTGISEELNSMPAAPVSIPSQDEENMENLPDPVDQEEQP